MATACTTHYATYYACAQVVLAYSAGAIPTAWTKPSLSCAHVPYALVTFHPITVPCMACAHGVAVPTVHMMLNSIASNMLLAGTVGYHCYAIN